jgi:dipeptidyl-peptidase-4
MKPSTFDPTKKYPLLMSMYGGPNFGSDEEAFSVSDPITELGFLVVWVDGRGSAARGVAFRQAVYRSLGGPEVDDMAATARQLAGRSYVDVANIGAYGTSYGGYAALLCLLRYPELFKAASCSSPVTDWLAYDTIYTERYMGRPDENKDGYERASALNKIGKLRGKLQLFFGSADDNVHPSHTLRLISLLDSAQKGYDLAIGPDQEHTSVSEARMMEFFIRALKH